MPRALYLCSKLFRLTPTIVIASCAFVTAALGQASAVALPATCSAYSSIPVPAEEVNTPVPKVFPACASYRSYRGIGRPVNYAAARACAWKERLAQKADLEQNQKEPTAWVVGGSLILADIYYNGAGVKRNIPLAMRFSCESEDGMAMLALPDIQKLIASHRAHGLFEFCDYALSTIQMTFCNSYSSQIDDDRRSRYYNSLKSSMTPAQLAAFEKLLTAQNAYVDTHALEVYQGGTIRGIRTIGSEWILNDLFHTEVVHFERKRWPDLSDRQVSMADVALNRQYKKTLQDLQTQPKDEFDDGPVTAGDLSRVEKTWETYRDAWVAFARLRYPAKVATIRAKITLDRYRLLKTIG